MLKTRKRWISLLVVLTFLLTLLPAGMASAATTNRVASVPTVADGAENVALGVVTFKEDSDFKSDLIANSTFTVTFPAGVKVKNSVSNFAYASTDGGDTWTPLTVVISGDYTVDVTLPGSFGSSTVDAIQLRPIVTIDGFEGGDIEITVDSFDSGITGGKFVIGRVEAGNTTAGVISVPTIGEAGEGGTIRITETSVNAIGTSPQWITLKLPSGFEWDETEMGWDNRSNVVYFMAGLSGSTFSGSSDWVLDGRTFKFKFTPASRSQRGIIQIVPYIIAKSDADYGDVEVSLSGDEIDEADLVIAKYADFGVSLEADGDLEEVLSGQFDCALTKLYIKENVDGSLIPNRKTKITFPNWVKITDVDVTGSKNTGTTDSALETTIKNAIDGTSNEVEFVIPDGAGKTEFKLKFTVSVKANASGDIVAEVTGRAGVEGEVILGKAVTPVTVTAEAKDIRVGVKDQPIGDITITEAKKEAIAKGTLKVALPEGIEWSGVPKVEVTSGNIDLDLDGIDTDGNELIIPVDNESTKVSTIKISGATVDLDRTIPEGDVKASIKGDAVVANDKSQEGWLFGVADPSGSGKSDVLDEGEFDQSSCASVVVARVVTPAPGETKVTAVLKAGDLVMKVNDAEVTMDVAPYLKNSRLYVSARFCANAFGVSDQNIIWDGATRTATIMAGARIIQMKVGSNVMYVNGAAIAMDTAPELMPPGRVMLPIGWLAQALGAKPVWDQETQTATLEL